MYLEADVYRFILGCLLAAAASPRDSPLILPIHSCYVILSPLRPQECKQYLVWDVDATEDTTDHTTAQLFQAVDADKTGSDKKKKKRKAKRSTTSSDESSTSDDSSSSDS